MATIERSVKKKLSKAELAAEVARAVGAGRPVEVETVDFSDPNRPKTCLEVDFPILHINQIAAIESSSGAATKPIYQMMKWWARRPSSVFRSLLLSASMKAPDDPMEAAKAVWDAYYANHQKKGALRHLKVADIFMGGGTTVVEGSRLGMQMVGNDLNPVAWFVVKNAMAQVDRAEVQALLDAVEAEVKPQIMPFYACDCPRGHKGVWMRRSTGERMGPDFDPLSLTPEHRADYEYAGPEVIYTFWAKHGPCQVTGCGHRTPIMSSPVMAVKTLTVKAWEDYLCTNCGERFDVEEQDARMAPGVPLVVADTETCYAVRDALGGVTCPHCNQHHRHPGLKGKKNKKVELSLLVHPQWLAGTPKYGPNELEYGGSVTDTPEATAAWNQARASEMRLVEVRGALPEEVTCPETGVTFRTDEGTVPKRSNFACGNCGTTQDIMASVKATTKSAPIAAYAIQGYCPACDEDGRPYSGRFFAAATESRALDAADSEWAARKDADLLPYWPRAEVPYGFMTAIANSDIRANYGFTHWWTMFNPKQLLVHSQLLRAILDIGAQEHRWETREFLLGAFQQYLRFNCMFTVYHPKNDQATKHFANNNFHPRNTLLEVAVFAPVGDGRWTSAGAALLEGVTWKADPWDLVPTAALGESIGSEGRKSEKVWPGDRVIAADTTLLCGSATDLGLEAASLDLVITDPPFGGLIHYSELSDFFYAWLQIALKDRYPRIFGGEASPKALEAVSNPARQPDDADEFYQRLLTECWREAYRLLKPGGILAFSFHHSEDEPWVAVLESLFKAGFYLEATYPIRADTSMDSGQFGSKTIEYDILHVCRKRTVEPEPVSWGRMRREVLRDVRQLQEILEHHTNAGLPAADVQVIKRGKALEYFSRHYGKVYVDEGREFTVRDALIGINQLLDEEAGKTQDPPPVNAEPMTRQFLRLFDARTELRRDEMQKLLHSTGVAPSEFIERGWCSEQKKVFYPAHPLDFAQQWHGQRRAALTRDYDQAMVLIGACVEGSGINATDTLKNAHFRPHPALKALLQWHTKRAGTPQVRSAAQRALQIYIGWEQQQPATVKTQLAFFDAE